MHVCIYVYVYIEKMKQSKDYESIHKKQKRPKPLLVFYSQRKPLKLHQAAGLARAVSYDWECI